MYEYEYKRVGDVPADLFKREFIDRLGRSELVSRIVCGGANHLSPQDWETIRSGLAKLGLSVSSDEDAESIVRACVARAVTARF